MASTPPSGESLRPLLSDLYAQPGVCGACLQMGNSVLIHDLPFADERINNLAGRIDELIAGYENVGRPIWQICAGFEKFRLLILCRGRLRLSILLQPETDPAPLTGRATRLLMEVDLPEFLEPSSEGTPTKADLADTIPRYKLEQTLGALMSRVTSSGTAGKIIQRQLADKEQNLSINEARRIGTTILATIPNRGKREALISEFLNAIQ